MEIKSQLKNTLVDIIQHELNKRHWKPIDLSRYSGVKQPVISRFMNGGINIKVGSIYKILITLNLLNVGKEYKFMCGWSQESIKACETLKEILESNDETTQKIIMFAIKEFKEKRELKKKSSGLRSESRKKGCGKKTGT